MNEQQSALARRRSRAEADELVGACEASGLSRREFCKQHGLSLNTLNRYCARRRASTEPVGGRWVEVEIAGAATKSVGDASGLALHVANNRRIEIRRGFDPGTLEQLLRVLERIRVFSTGPATHIYLAAGATGMRKGFEGLYGLVRDRLRCEPLSGHLFLFANRERNRLKVVFGDGSGLWACAKRLEKGRSWWPEAAGGETKIQLSHEELSLLPGGIDFAASKRRPWFRRITSP